MIQWISIADCSVVASGQADVHISEHSELSGCYSDGKLDGFCIYLFGIVLKEMGLHGNGQSANAKSVPVGSVSMYPLAANLKMANALVANLAKIGDIAAAKMMNIALAKVMGIGVVKPMDDATVKLANTAAQMANTVVAAVMRVVGVVVASSKTSSSKSSGKDFLGELQRFSWV